MVSYANEKDAYQQKLKENADAQIEELVKQGISKETAEQIIYNKTELHDARILIGVLSQAIIKNGVISKEDLEKSIAEAYASELDALRA